MARTRGRGVRAREGTGQQAEEDSHPLAELVRESHRASTAQEDDGGRAVKKRRIAGRLVVQGTETDGSGPVHSSSEHKHSGDAEPTLRDADGTDQSDNDSGPGTPLAQQQITRDDSSSEDDDGSDWEDVDLDAGARAAQSPATGKAAPPKELSITLLTRDDKRTTSGQAKKRTALTAADRKLRLELHKVHVLCLLGHAALRNAWCNDAAIQAAALAALPPRAADYLRDDASQSQFQRGRLFAEGLQMAVEGFSQRFEVSARGLSRPRWAASADSIGDLDLPDDAELPLLKDDFLDCAKDMSASRDVGAQIFVAALRALGVEARLVVSLQALPLGGVQSGTPADPSRAGAPVVEHTETRTGMSGTPGKKKKKRVPESRFPVYWVEAFARSHQKWHAVDPLVTCTVSKPSKIEPPLTDTQNQLAYAMAFEADGSARDVTRRYTRAYNAKTRRTRVEAFKGGDQWWANLLRLYTHRVPSRARRDRDAIEDAQLTQRAAQEPMPRAIVDFKGHPVYALERHLRRNEVVHPRRSIGKVDVGQGGRAEDVFRRSDVHVVRSADAWFREGREVKGDVQALSLGKPRKGIVHFDEEEPETQPGVPLFAIFQTELYRPPPVVRGRVPRNAFGNLDIYVPSMIPPGGVHVRHPAASKAARLLGIDHATAVTGFEFRGRTGSAVMLGAIVAEEYAEAVVNVIVGFAEDEWRERVYRRRAGLLGLWKKFLVGLRIRERIQGYAVEGEDGEEESAEDSEDTYDPDEDDTSATNSESSQPRQAESVDEEEFSPPIVEVVRAVFAKPEPAQKPPKAERQQVHARATDTISPEAEGGFLLDAGVEGGGFFAEDSGGGFVPSDSGGGFLPDNKSGGFEPETLHDGGGFLPEAKDAVLADALSVAASDRSDEMEEAQLAWALAESARDAATKAVVPGGLDGPASDTVNPEDDKSAAVKVAAEDNQEEQLKTDQTTHSSEEGSDVGSLLSHDPEDEDAIPDWLV